MILSLFIVLNVILGQAQYPYTFTASPNITNKASSNQITTQYDGANADIYVQYLSLNGSTGIKVPLANASVIAQELEYTIMMWLKPTGDDWNNRISYILQIADSFECYFTQTQSATCESIQGFQKLNASTESSRVNQWIHFTVSGSMKNRQSYLLIESHSEVIGEDSNTYISLEQPNAPWTLTLGYYGEGLNFIGGIRDFIFLYEYIGKAESMILKNNYLTWDFSILGYYRFSEAMHLREEFRNWNASLIGSTSLSQQRDLVANDICYPFLNSDQFLTFNNDQVLNNMTIGSRWSPQTNNYSYTMSLWIKPNQFNCYQSVPYKASRDCNIVQFYDVFMIYFDSPTTVRAYFFALENYYELSSSPLFIPLDQWVNIQLAFNQYFGFTLQTYDMQGRQMQSLTKVYNMQQQSLLGKNLGLLQNFRGHARNFILWSKYLSLPLSVGQGGYYSDKNFMFFFKFQPQYNSGIHLTNYGDNSGTTQDGLFNKTAVYQYQVFYDSVANGQSTMGLASSTVQLFDKVACNDGHFTLQMINNTSYVKGQTSSVSKWMNQTTVEFWFKPQDFSSINYVFSLYSNSTQSEFFSIYVNTDESLVCAPFGTDSLTSPYVSYDGLTDPNIDEFSWFHLVCSYNYQSAINGYLYNSYVDETYFIDLQEVPNYLPNGTYDVYIGNNYQLNQGSPNMFFKDLRIWSYERSQAQISSLRYQQLNSLSFSTNDLIGYFRMAEASFNEFDYESLANNLTQKYASINQIQYAYDQQVIVCPVATYYSEGYCYDDPFKFLLLNVFPVFNTVTQFLNWNFTLRHSSILNQSIFEQLEINWSTSDLLINALTESQNTELDMIISSQAFANQLKYEFTAGVSNSQSTFFEDDSISFVPVSCQWVIVEGSDSYSSYLNYQNPQSTKDINFTLAVQTLNSGCNSYYDTLLPNISYDISPAPSSMPILKVTQPDANTLVVTIPRGEQYKMGVLQDNKIIISVYWTNSEYSQYLDTSSLTFQNVLYTINFAYQVMMVVPILTASSTIALQGDQIELDASQSYISTLQAPEKYNNLTFEWLCPLNIPTICQDQTSSTLNIGYSQFLNAGGVLNESQQFQVEIIWSSPDGSPIVYYTQTSLVWYNLTDPLFDIDFQDPILSTGSNQINLTFQNYNSMNVSKLNIDWSIVPNISESLMTLSNDSTILSVSPNAFKQDHKYTINVQATNRMYPIANRLSQLVFTTGYAPYGGQALITPMKGYYNYTNFTFYLQNWTSAHLPMKYQVWQTANASSSIPVTMVSNGWIDYASNFTFQTNSSNPYIVVITDEGKEVAYSTKITLSLSTYKQNSSSSSSNSASSSSSKPSSSSSSNTSNSSSSSSKKSNSSSSSSYSSNSTNKSSSSSSNSSSNMSQYNSSNSTVNSTQVFLLNLISNTLDIVSKYNYMNQLSSNVLSQNQEQVTNNINTLLNEIQSDNENYADSDDITNTEMILANSVQILSNVLSNTNLLNDDQAIQSLAITQSIQDSSLFQQQIESGSDFLQTYAQSLSLILKYKNSKIMNNNNRRRNLQVAADIGTTVTQQISTLSNQVCSLLTLFQNFELLQTDSYQISLYKFNMNSQQKSIKLSFNLENETFINLDLYSLKQEISQIGNIDITSLCVQAIYYLENPLLSSLQSQKGVSQYSLATLELDIVDGSLNSIQSFTDLQLYAQIIFQVNPQTYSNNQTICFQYDSIQENWNSQSCLTTLDISDQSLICYCKQSQGFFYTLASDLNRELGAQVFRFSNSNSSSLLISSQQDSQNTSQTTTIEQTLLISHSFAFISFIITMVLFTVLLAVIMVILDRKDIQSFQEKIENSARLQLLIKVSQISGEPLSYWMYKQDQVLSYNFKSISLFSHLLHQMHPLLNIISKFDILQSRMIRFSLFLLQLSAYSLICVQVFNPHYRQDDLQNGERKDQAIDEKDINAIILVGLIGMVILLPIPISLGKCFKSKMMRKQEQVKDATNQSICNQNTSLQRAHIYAPEFTQENNNSVSIQKSAINILRDDSLVHNINDSVLENANRESQQMIFKPQCLLVKNLLLIVAYLLAITSMVLCIVYSKAGPQFNQYCMIASFYIGLMGSMFITNILRILIQAILIKRLESNPQNKCLRVLISAEALRIHQEIQYCRKADKALIMDQLNNSQISKKLTVKHHVQKCYNEEIDLGDIMIQEQDRFDQNSPSQEVEYSVPKDQSKKSSSRLSGLKKDKRVSELFQKCSDSVMKTNDKAEDSNFRKSMITKARSPLGGIKQVKYSCVTENEKYKQAHEREILA